MFKNQEAVEKMMDLLGKCTLEEERKVYWRGRFEKRDLSGTEFDRFLAELQESAMKATGEVKEMKEELAAEEEELSGLEDKALEHMKDAYPAVIEEMEGVVKDFDRKSTGIVVETEKAAEGAGKEKAQEEIEAIRKRLG